MGARVALQHSNRARSKGLSNRNTPHVKRVAGVVVEEPAGHTGDVSANGKLDEKGGGGVGGVAAVESHAAGDEPDDHEGVADVMRIGAVAETGNA